MLLFAVLMIIASYSMIKKKIRKAHQRTENKKFNYPLIIVEGALVGLITGLVGAEEVFS
jgi:uncharacterized membrane protein YfcA